MFNPFTGIKSLLAMVVAGFSLLFAVKYNNMSKKLKRKNAEVDALKEDLEVQDIVHESDMLNKDLINEIQRANADIKDDDYDVGSGRVNI